MLTCNFDIAYKKGSEMPADFLSRNVVNALSFKNRDLKTGQKQDPALKSLYDFLISGTIPNTRSKQY